MIAGECGFERIDTFEVADLACQIAAVVPRGDGADGAFNPDDWFDPKEQRKVDDFIIFGACAATQALTDAGWKADTAEKQETTGVLIGSGIGGLGGIYETVDHAEGEGPAPRVALLHFRPDHQSRLAAMSRSCMGSRARIMRS